MVELANVPQVGGSVADYQSILRALDTLEQGGRIVAMEIAAPAPPPVEGAPRVAFGARVSTEGMEYPPQMVASIKTLLQARRDALKKQLADLGVTGLDQAAQPAGKGK